MNRHHQSWELALMNFMVTFRAIKASRQSLSTIFTSYSRISTFVYCRIHILNAAELEGIVVLMQPYKLLPSKFFCTGSCFFNLFSSFSSHTSSVSRFEKMKVRLHNHISLSNNLLILLWNFTKLAAGIFLSIF